MRTCQRGRSTQPRQHCRGSAGVGGFDIDAYAVGARRACEACSEDDRRTHAVGPRRATPSGRADHRILTLAATTMPSGRGLPPSTGHGGFCSEWSSPGGARRVGAGGSGTTRPESRETAPLTPTTPHRRNGVPPTRRATPSSRGRWYRGWSIRPRWALPRYDAPTGACCPESDRRTVAIFPASVTRVALRPTDIKYQLGPTCRC